MIHNSTPVKLNPEQTYPLFYTDLMPVMPDGSFYFVDNVRKLPMLFEEYVTNGDIDKALQLLTRTIDDLETFLQARFQIDVTKWILIGCEPYLSDIILKTYHSNLIRPRCQILWKIESISRQCYMLFMSLFVLLLF